MSHGSGIEIGQALSQVFHGLYSSDDVRLVKVVIENDVLTAANVVNAEGSERDDYDRSVLSVIEEKEPCYILFRLDSKNQSGSNFLFISYSPDFAHVRKKMVYASTRATLKSGFGTHHITDELFGTVPEDVSLSGYDKHTRCANAPAPLTMAEHEKAEIRAVETGVDIGSSTRRALTTGVDFPLTAEAVAAVEQYAAGAVSYVQLAVNIPGEKIEVTLTGDHSADEVGKALPADQARYSLIRFKHNHEGDNLESNVFVYSCPGYKLPVKERMLYASCKNPVMEDLEARFAIKLDTKMEVGDALEVSQEALYEALHPVKVVFKQKFARPPPPGGRRLTSRASTTKAPKEGAAGDEEDN